MTTELKIIITKSNTLSLIAFGIDVCERLIADYVVFFDKYNWGNPDVLCRAIKYCKEIKFSQIDVEKVGFLIAEVENVIPDTECFEGIEVSYALNSACSILDLLKFIVKQDKVCISNISSYVTDTIDFKIQESESNLTNEELQNHLKIIEELKRQIMFLELNAV